MKNGLKLFCKALLFVTLALPGLVNGQEMLGVTFSSYSGISSTMLNPAFMTNSRFYVDVNILSGNFFLENNMYYIPSDYNTINKTISGDLNLNEGPYKYNRAYTYFDNTKDKYYASNIRVMGPSALVQNGKHAFALTTAFRINSSGNNIPYQIPINFYEKLGYEKFLGVEFNDDNFSLVGMSWAELGLSYAYDFYQNNNSRWTFGVSAKALLGVAGAYTEVRNVNYVIVNDNTINFINFDTDFGYALPQDYQNNDFVPEPYIKGYGFGIDAGIAYTLLKSEKRFRGQGSMCSKAFRDYILIIGLSLMDAGKITFSKNAELQRFDNVSKYWEQFDTIQYQSISSSMQSYSIAFYGNPDSSLYANTISIGTPAALSLQADYHILENVYAGFLWMQPIQFNLRTIYRPAQLALIPRYENRNFGISMPLTLFNYSQPAIGLALRVYSFTIGTEGLAAWLGISNFTGMDIYFALKFNLEKGSCDRTKRSNGGACSNSDFGNKKYKSRYVSF